MDGFTKRKKRKEEKEEEEEKEEICNKEAKTLIIRIERTRQYARMGEDKARSKLYGANGTDQEIHRDSLLR